MKSHHWFKSYGHFIEGVDLVYWWSFIGKGLRLQLAQQACFLLYNKLLMTHALMCNTITDPNKKFIYIFFAAAGNTKKMS